MTQPENRFSSSFTRGRFIASLISAILILSGIIFLNWWLFRRFDRSYFQWYLDTGPLIGLVAAIASIPMSMRVDMIDTNPFKYLSSYLLIIGTTFYAMGSPMRTHRHAGPYPLWDTLCMTFLTIMLFGAAMVWLFVVVPLQYFFFLVSGAPARLALKAGIDPVAAVKESDGGVHVSEQTSTDKAMGGVWNISLKTKPFVVTNAFNAALLYVLNVILTYFGVSA